MSGFERGPGRSLAEHVDQAIEAAFADQRLVGAVVLVAHRGQWLYRRAAGLADREAGRTMGEDSLFRLASVSKPIVSVAALSLVDEGRLALDEPIADWLPAFRPRLADGREARITPRQLLSHSAGLGYRFLEADADGPYARAGISDGMDLPGFDLAENLRRLASVPLLYEPGRAWGYSLATDVLGALVARVDGRPLAEALRQRVGIPAGMRDSGFLCADAQRLAAVYVSDRPRPRRMAERETVAPFEDSVGIRFEPSRAFEPSAYASGGAGMIGSAGDVLRLLEILRQGGAPLLTPGLVEEMGRDQVPGLELPANPGFGFGLGFSVLRDPAIAQSPESPGTWRWAAPTGIPGSSTGPANCRWWRSPTPCSRACQDASSTTCATPSTVPRRCADGTPRSISGERRGRCVGRGAAAAAERVAGDGDVRLRRHSQRNPAGRPAAANRRGAGGQRGAGRATGQRLCPGFATGRVAGGEPDPGLAAAPGAAAGAADLLRLQQLHRVSSDYRLTLLARFGSGVAAASPGAAGGYARRLVPPEQQGRALAVAMLGAPLALSLGVPLGTWLGGLLGWRWAFACCR
ncbi:putative beta lactamase [Pseudomonas aeruginosa]|nr:putative beta lactamase [Pseudomonas aeruginosa]